VFAGAVRSVLQGSPLLGSLKHLEDLLDHQIGLILWHVVTAGHHDLTRLRAELEPSLLIFDIRALLFILVVGGLLQFGASRSGSGCCWRRRI
jgi:hypothetical protein